jgi:hypothetical protein
MTVCPLFLLLRWSPINSVVSVLWAGEFLHDLIQAETRWLLAGRERSEGMEALSHKRLSRDEQIDAIYSPARVVGGFILGALERISMQTDQDGHAKLSEGLLPHVGTMGALDEEGASICCIAVRYRVISPSTVSIDNSAVIFLLSELSGRPELNSSGHSVRTESGQPVLPRLGIGLFLGQNN